MDRTAAEAALDARPGTRGPKYTPAERVARQRAQTRAQADARSALAQIHREEYSVLYRVALGRRLAAEGLDVPQG